MMMDIIPGKHFTFVDPTLHERTDQMVAQAERLIRGFEKKGIFRERIIISVSVTHRLFLPVVSPERSLVKIPATEAGVHAAQLLKKKTVNIQTNLTYVSGFIHASICAEAGADVITFCCEPVSQKNKQRSEMSYKRHTKFIPDVKCLQNLALHRRGTYRTL